MNHDLVLTKLQIRVFEGIMSKPGWVDDIRGVYNCGQLLERFADVRGPIPEEWTEESPWNEEEVTVVVTEAQRDLMKKAFTKAFQDGKIAPSPIHLTVIEQLGLCDGD